MPASRRRYKAFSDSLAGVSKRLGMLHPRFFHSFKGFPHSNAAEPQAHQFRCFLEKALRSVTQYSKLSWRLKPALQW